MANVAIVQAESELADIAMQMLRAGVVIDAVNTPLKHRKDALDTVCGNIAPHILASAVIAAWRSSAVNKSVAVLGLSNRSPLLVFVICKFQIALFRCDAQPAFRLVG